MTESIPRSIVRRERARIQGTTNRLGRASTRWYRRRRKIGNEGDSRGRDTRTPGNRPTSYISRVTSCRKQYPPKSAYESNWYRCLISMKRSPLRGLPLPLLPLCLSLSLSLFLFLSREVLSRCGKAWARSAGPVISLILSPLTRMELNMACVYSARQKF